MQTQLPVRGEHQTRTTGFNLDHSIAGFLVYWRRTDKKEKDPKRIIYEIADNNDWGVIHPRLTGAWAEVGKLVREGWELEDLYVVGVYRDPVGRCIFRPTMFLHELKRCRVLADDFKEALG